MGLTRRSVQGCPGEAIGSLQSISPRSGSPRAAFRARLQAGEEAGRGGFDWDWSWGAEGPGQGPAAVEVELLFGKVILEPHPPPPPPSQEGVPRKDSRLKRSATGEECGLDVGAGMNVKSLNFKSSYAGRW